MRRAKPVPLELAEVLVTALVMALFVRTFLFQAFSIPSGSMEQNLLVGDRILVNKFIYSDVGPDWLSRLLPARPIRRGDVVVFRFPLDPDRDFIKRCVGLPGDTLEIERRHLVIDDAEVDESGYVYFTDDNVYPRSVALPEGLRHRDNFGPYRLGETSYFCLGDNRNNSHDSRVWGAVPEDNVKGRAWLIYWSNAPDLGPPPEPDATVEPAPAETTTPKARHPIRWDRMLQVVR